MKAISTDRLLTLGLALYSDKRTMENRVRGIFGRKRTAWFARVLAAALCLVVGVACFTTACKPVTTAAAGAETAPQADSTLGTVMPYDVHAAWTGSFTVNNVAFIADAVSIEIEQGAHPVYRIRNLDYTQADGERLLAYFAKDVTGIRPAGPTKAELRTELQNARENPTLVWDEETQAYSLGIHEEYETQAEREIAVAPEGAYTPYNEASFPEYPAYFTYRQADGRETEINAKPIYLWCYPDNGQGGPETEQGILSRKAEYDLAGIRFPEKVTIEPEISQEQAEEEMRRLFYALDRPDMRLGYAQPARWTFRSGAAETDGWLVRYERHVQGSVPTDDSHMTTGSTYYDDNINGDVTRSNTLGGVNAYVDGAGIRWVAFDFGNYEIVETVQENAKLLPFEEVIACMKAQAKEGTEAWGSNGKSVFETLTVSRVLLTSLRVQDPEKAEEALLTPAWVFLCENREEPDVAWDCFAVNAIDGSRVPVWQRIPKEA